MSDAQGGHRPRKRFGQHFLHDQRVLERIVAAIAPGPQDALVEIGPGQGALTRRLLERVPSIDAVEIDRDLADLLEREFPRERLRVHRADALEFDFASLPEGLRVVGNLPYNISTPILFHLTGFAERLRDLHFMLQLEVVERMVARPSTPEYGRLSVMLQVRFRMEKLFEVGAGAFNPPPKVESAVVRMRPLPRGERPEVDERAFADLVRRAFSGRRKNLRNALGLEARVLESLGFDPSLRPENLAPADYVRIAQSFAGKS
jgi:16S rRNA (adenine1518-N6/adenine1519-N6)-dimethyltransferase